MAEGFDGLDLGGGAGGESAGGKRGNREDGDYRDQDDGIGGAEAFEFAGQGASGGYAQDSADDEADD